VVRLRGMERGRGQASLRCGAARSGRRSVRRSGRCCCPVRPGIASGSDAGAFAAPAAGPWWSCRFAAQPRLPRPSLRPAGVETALLAYYRLFLSLFFGLPPGRRATSRLGRLFGGTVQHLFGARPARGTAERHRPGGAPAGVRAA